MADEIDLANDLMDAEVTSALRRLREESNKQTKGSKFCLVCGDKMPAGRTKLGFTLCIPCVEESERKKALYGE